MSQTATTQPKLENNYQVYSVYIPKIYKGRGIEKIGSVFFELRVGKVTRVDFVPLKNERDSGNYHSAFVYFTKLYTDKPNRILDEIESKGIYLLNLDANNGVSRDTNSEYWHLRKNNTPFEETTMNIHQLSHNMKLMEEKMAKMEIMMATLNEKNIFLEEENATLKKDLDRLKTNIETTMDDFYVDLDESQNKISRLHRTGSKLIDQIFAEPDITKLNNDMVYGIPYPKRLLRNDTDYGDSDNEMLDNNLQNNEEKTSENDETN
jgi:regulator of replication initiation timing